MTKLNSIAQRPVNVCRSILTTHSLLNCQNSFWHVNPLIVTDCLIVSIAMEGSAEKNSGKKFTCHLPVCSGEVFDWVHKIPSDLDRALKWIDAMDCPDLRNLPRWEIKRIRICTRHFRREDYRNLHTRKLNTNVMPSLNLKKLDQLHLTRDPTPKENKKSNELVLDSIADTFVVKNEAEAEAEAEGDEDEDVGNVTAESSESMDDSESEDSVIGTTDSVKLSEPFLEVSHTMYEANLAFSHFWLRCICRCSLCYNETTSRRIITPMQIPVDITPKTVHQDDEKNTLRIEWNGGHISEYDMNIIFTSNKKTSVEYRIPWHISRNPQSIDGFTPVEFTKLIIDQRTVEITFDSLLRYGIAAIKNVPIESNAMANLLICRLFPHLQSVSFNPFNEIHTDVSSNLTYSNAECGLKCFIATQRSRIILVDGLAATLQLDSDAFNTLSEVVVPLEIDEPHVKWSTESPIIENDSETGQVVRLRLDLHRLGALNTVIPDEIKRFYDSLTKLVGIVQSQRNRWAFTALPGTMVVLDSWRILHKIVDSAGVLQCYLERKDYTGRLRSLGLI